MSRAKKVLADSPQKGLLGKETRVDGRDPLGAAAAVPTLLLADHWERVRLSLDSQRTGLFRWRRCKQVMS